MSPSRLSFLSNGTRNPKNEWVSTDRKFTIGAFIQEMQSVHSDYVRFKFEKNRVCLHF